MERGFQRARTDAQRAQRRDSILAAARAALASKRAADTTLTDIAAGAGVAKSAVLRYFTSREAVLLEIFQTDYAAWADQVVQQLRPLPSAPAQPTRVARILAATALGAPAVAEMLGSVGSVLEHNVTAREVADFKIRIARAATPLREQIEEKSGTGPAPALLVGIHSLIAHVWVLDHPAPALVEARGLDPRVPPHQDATALLAELIAALVRGLSGGRGPDKRGRPRTRA